MEEARGTTGGECGIPSLDLSRPIGPIAYPAFDGARAAQVGGPGQDTARQTASKSNSALWSSSLSFLKQYMKSAPRP
jgi:hypothetical protein